MFRRHAHVLRRADHFCSDSLLCDFWGRSLRRIRPHLLRHQNGKNDLPGEVTQERGRMSFAESGRNLRPESGKPFPLDASEELSFSTAIADALRRDFGSNPSAVKRVARLVRANERGVRNWFEGRNGPSGEHLVLLMRHSNAVLEIVLALCGRYDLVHTQLVFDAKERVRQILSTLDTLLLD
ncbi:hypothetical protein ACO2Q3_12585 [Caulobacter sp. KR2-114]|uniref:hypothetical protein n=1 Tax=Caulobacter sp. KR2-114 TaxID=3400912 RepID=UPI003BFEF64F